MLSEIKRETTMRRRCAIPSSPILDTCAYMSRNVEKLPQALENDLFHLPVAFIEGYSVEIPRSQVGSESRVEHSALALSIGTCADDDTSPTRRW